MDENKEEKSTQYTGEYGNSVEGNYQEEGSSVYSYSYNNKKDPQNGCYDGHSAAFGAYNRECNTEKRHCANKTL